MGRKKSDLMELAGCGTSSPSNAGIIFIDWETGWEGKGVMRVLVDFFAPLITRAFTYFGLFLESALRDLLM
jgi:hypothetical protein